MSFLLSQCNITHLYFKGSVIDMVQGIFPRMELEGCIGGTKKSVVFQTEKLPFKQHLDSSLQSQAQVQGVKVAKITEDTSPPQRIYDPSHPDAKEDGYVELPNISTFKEMVDMMSATRSYEANTTTIKSAKRMAMKALEIGR